MNAIQTIAARASTLSAAGYFDHDSDEVVPSPCVSVCRMSADGSLCEGCFRSIAEIRGWSMACLLYTSPSPRDRTRSRMPSSA